MDILIEFAKGMLESYGYIAIFVFTTAEQFIWPIPADLFLGLGTGMGLNFNIILILMLVGALGGSTIGYLLGKYLGHPVLIWLFSKKKIDYAEGYIKKYGMWGVIVAALTPIPFKLVTWSAGAFEMPFGRFFLGVIIGRIPRYLLTAYVGAWLYKTQFYTSVDMSAVILGALQGITEFLPISSSGHLIIMESFLKLPITLDQMELFDIFLHGGSLLAIVIYFWKDWVNVFKEFFAMIKNRKLNKNSMTFKLVIATIPAIIVGLLFKDYIGGPMRNLHSIATFFIIIGIIYFYVAWKGENNKENNVSTKNSLLIGISQSLALIPGISRAGSTIATGVFLGLKREVAARFSFMLGGIAILAANVYALVSINNGAIVPDLKFTLIGFCTSFIVSFITIAFLLKYLQKHTLRAFGYYLIIAGSLIWMFL